MKIFIIISESENVVCSSVPVPCALCLVKTIDRHYIFECVCMLLFCFISDTCWSLIWCKRALRSWTMMVSWTTGCPINRHPIKAHPFFKQSCNLRTLICKVEFFSFPISKMPIPIPCHVTFYWIILVCIFYFKMSWLFSQTYLQRFNHMGTDNMLTGELRTEDDLVAAVESFQSMANLTITG